MTFRLVQELAADGIPVAVACRELEVSRSGYYEWAGREPSKRSVADASLTDRIIEIHRSSRASYGAPRVLPRRRGCPQPSSSSGWACAAAANASPG